MKKLVSLIVALFVLTLLFAACTEQPQEQESQPESTEEATEACTHDWMVADCYNPRTCRLCQATEGSAQHDYVLDENETVRPNCTGAGVEQYYCSVCDDPDVREVPPLGHDYIEGVCSRCDATEPQE